jgi:hypothetical protein
MAIEQEKMPRMMQGRAAFDFFALTTKDAPVVTWEQRDSYTGLQQLRGLGGKPNHVQAVAGKRYSYIPGTYGEFRNLDETEMTLRRQWGTFGTPIKLDDLVMEASEMMQQRFLDRVESTIWAVLGGTFQILGQAGQIMHEDGFNNQIYTAIIEWLNPATATPLQNYRDIQLLSRGQSVSFGADAKSYMNRRTFNYLIANTNAADLYGKRTQGLATVMTLDQVNAVLAGEGLPMIVIYDQGYLMDPATGQAVSRALFTPFIPDNVVYVIGTRPGGAKVGEYIMTRNVNNPDMSPGQYTKVIDLGENQVPRSVEVHNGHNGGPTILYPGAVVKMNV